jgi:hypothetical protein
LSLFPTANTQTLAHTPNEFNTSLLQSLFDAFQDCYGIFSRPPSDLILLSVLELTPLFASKVSVDQPNAARENQKFDILAAQQK